MKTKEEIRKEALEKRSSLTEEQIEKKSQEIQEKSLKELEKAETVLVYAFYRKEVRTDDLIQDLLDLGKEVGVPKTEGKKITPVKISSLEDLTENPDGIREPATGKKLEKKEIDACITPGLKFDKQGNRIGYGEGYYDRFLQNFKGEKIGLTYQELIEEKIPTDEWDIQMDKIITEKKVYRGQK